MAFNLPGSLALNLPPQPGMPAIDALGGAVRSLGPTLPAWATQAAPVATDAPGPAKPPVGTPPFAVPHPNTGGAEPPAPASHADLIGQALQRLVGGQQQQPQQHGFAGFMDRIVNPSNALGQLGQALLMGGGGPLGNAMAVLDVQRQRKAAAGQDQAKIMLDQLRWDSEQQDKVAERNKPQFFSGNEDRVMLDPTTGTTKLLYDAPTPAEAYAKSLGLDTTTDEGRTALRDFVLRSSGPTALEGDISLEDARFGHRVAIHGMPTFRQSHPGAVAPSRRSSPSVPRTTGNVYAPILAKMARGEPLSSGEQQVMALRGGRRGGGTAASASGGYPEGTVIKNAAGQRMQRRGGGWVTM